MEVEVGGPIVWRLSLATPPERVFELLDTDEGRVRFWAERSRAVPGGFELEIRKRKFPIVGDGSGMFSFVHLEDAAAATVLALERGEPGVYDIVDDEPAPAREWLPALAEILGAKPPRRIPRWLARLLAGEAAVVLMTEARGASNAKAKRELGVDPPSSELATRVRGCLQRSRLGRLPACPRRSSRSAARISGRRSSVATTSCSWMRSPRSPMQVRISPARSASRRSDSTRWPSAASRASTRRSSSTARIRSARARCRSRSGWSSSGTGT